MRLVGGAAKTARPTPEPEPGFATFWAAYPRRVGKLAALHAWQKALRLATAEDLIAGARRYALEMRDQEAQFICHPRTWLTQGRWLDEPMTTTGATSLPSMMTCPHEPPCIYPGRQACLHKTNVEKFRRGEL